MVNGKKEMDVKALSDSYGRRFDYLRISLTDRCNLNCIYCSRGELINKKEILTFEEIENVVGVFSELGIKKVRFTGGEPFLRRGFEILIEKIREKFPHLELGITTNGVLLYNKVEFLRKYNISVNVSIDTLSEEKFAKITGGYFLKEVIKGIDNSCENGLKVKINTVVMKGVNEDEILDLVKFAIERGVEIRFIELMPISISLDFWKKHFLPNSYVKEKIQEKFKMEHIIKDTIADIYRVDNIKVGFISSISEPFCSMCSRIRLTSDGRIVLCLFDKFSYSIKKFLRPEFQKEKLIEFLNRITKLKPKGFVELKNEYFYGKGNIKGLPMRMMGG